MAYISIIVPVYNAEKDLTRCIDSILSQTFTDFELLLVDDGSDDSSPALCNRYALLDHRIIVLNKANGGPSSARNLGLDNVKGEWVTFCDADDYVESNWLESLVGYAKGDLNLISCGFFCHHSDSTISEIIPQTYSGDGKGYTEAMSSSYMFGSLWTKLFKKQIIDKYALRFNERIRFREDEEFVLRYLTHSHKCRTVDVALYHYYMPDWNKYTPAFTHGTAIYLLKQLRSSCRKLKLRNQYSRQIDRELLQLRISLFGQPLKSILKLPKLLKSK